MEFHVIQLTVSVSSSLVFFYFLIRLFWLSRGKKGLATGKKLPEAAGRWPLIGHLHLLGGQKLLHIALAEMADKYGPVFSIWLGGRRVMVVSSKEVAKECLTTNESVFFFRPKSIAMETMDYNYALFPFCPYGSYWRALRKISMSELMSNRRLGMLSHVWESEVKEAIRDAYKQCLDNKKDGKVLIEMKKWFGKLSMNIDCRLMVGRRLKEKEGELCLVAFRDFFDLMGVFTVGDAFPWLRWLDIGGYEKKMKKNAKDIDGLLQRWLDENKEKKDTSRESDDDRHWSFMEALVNVVDESVAATAQPQALSVDTINKTTCLNLALASMESMTISLTWILSLLLNNRETLKKAQEELDIHVGRTRRVKESDMKNLVYLEAIIKETLRLHPATQILPPREAVEDCNVVGYHVPGGTQLLINIWNIHHDERVWVDPCAFKPERFLAGGPNADTDVRGQHFELIPFGSGRKVCAGISLAFRVIEFTVASLLHGFEVDTSYGEAVDMTESSGFVNNKVNPLEVVLTPRLVAEIYE